VQPVRVAEHAEASVLDGERKTVTALFADLKGSTELMKKLDPEEAGAIVDPALKLMIEAVRRYDGYVVQSTGELRVIGLVAPLMGVLGAVIDQQQNLGVADRFNQQVQ
jgi:class 3 adenylate cyclase